MQLFARRVAGLGRMPEVSTPAKRARRRSVDVLVVGAGPAGMAVAVAAARRGRRVEVVDDGLRPGGGMQGLLAPDEDFAAIQAAFLGAVARGAVVVRSRTVAAGFFGADLLVGDGNDDGGAEVVEAQAFVIAAGAHDGIVPFENNDLPGVMSARAACMLAAGGISVGDRVVLLAPTRTSVDGNEVLFGDVFDRAQIKAKVTRVGEVVRVKGSSGVRAVVVRDGGKERSIPADVLLVDAPRAPAYELCEQAGGKLAHRPAGYAPVHDRGRIAEKVWAIGEVTGASLAAGPFVRAAEEIAEQLSPPPASRRA
jgi:sarcosine oxidase subunit alpha